MRPTKGKANGLSLTDSLDFLRNPHPAASISIILTSSPPHTQYIIHSFSMVIKTRISADPGLLLSVVIPIDAQTCANSTLKSCEGAWLVQEDSECTEEEKVAVEQLTELRLIRDLSSMQEDANNCSCSTEGSFNTYEGRLPPLLASSHTFNKGDPSTSPAPSTSAARIFDFWKSRHKQEQQECALQLQQNQDVQDNFEDDMIDIQVAELDCDDDKHKKPRSRLLSDIYCDHSSSKAKKKRRKAISKIMSVGQPYGAVAMARGKYQSTHKLA